MDYVLNGLGELAQCIGCEVRACVTRTSDGYPICTACLATLPNEDE